MYVTLHARRKVVVDHFPHTLEIHPSRQDLCAHHHPAFPAAHTTYSIIPLLLSHTGMQTINVAYPIERQLFRQ